MRSIIERGAVTEKNVVIVLLAKEMAAIDSLGLEESAAPLRRAIVSDIVLFHEQVYCTSY